MPSSRGGFEQTYNAQAGVDVGTHLIVERHVTQQSNDKQEIEPALEDIVALPQELGEPENLLADTGYFSAANVQQCQEANVEPLIPEQREKHHLPLTERFKEDPKPPQNPNPVQAMKHRLQTQQGKRFTLNANPPLNPHSASSNTCWDSDNSCCVVWIQSRVNGRWSALD